MESRDKIKLIRKSEGLTQAKLADILSIPLNSIKNYERGERGISAAYLFKLSESFPQYTLWLMNDCVAPEAGQISPEDDAPQMGSAGVPAKLLDDSFFQTMNTAIALSWLTPKEGIEFSMLNDLFRHNFAEAGGVIVEQASTETASKTA